MKKTLVLILIAFLFLSVVAVSQVISFPKAETVSVNIKKGSSLSETASVLGTAGAVKNKYVFMVFALASGKYKHFYPGKYIFAKETPYFKAVDMLSKGPKKVIYKLTVPEGFTLGQIKKIMNSKLGVTENDFEQALEAKKSSFPDIGEGYLFPETYFFSGNAKASQVIDKLHQQFINETKKLKLLRGYSLRETVTIASLIETEAKMSSERFLISAVIYNRLRKGMKLEIDATIQYVLPQRKGKLSRKDLEVNSPYNTYLNEGIPPGPICSPGREALKAAVSPAKVDYLYYVLTNPKTGEHFFTSDYNKFLEAKRKARKGNSG